MANQLSTPASDQGFGRPRKKGEHFGLQFREFIIVGKHGGRHLKQKLRDHTYTYISREHKLEMD